MAKILDSLEFPDPLEFPGRSMRLLHLMVLVAVCFLQQGCIMILPADIAATGDHPNAHLCRGGPRNGCDWVVSPEVLQIWIREIPQIPKGTRADEVIKRLGQPDQDFASSVKFLDHTEHRELRYFVAMDEHPSTCWASIWLEFDPFNRYEDYLVDDPFSPNYYNVEGRPAPHDLLILLKDAPTACTLSAGP